MSTDLQSSTNTASTTSVIEGSPGRTPSSHQHPHPQGSERNLGQSGVGTQRDTGGRVEPAEEEGGAARGEGHGSFQGSGSQHSSSTPAEAEGADGQQKPPEPEGGYPEQLHAGKLDGVGPEYGRMYKATMKDRIDGAKEYVKGVVKRDDALKEDARETMSGEKKKKEREHENEADPFKDAGDDKSKEKNDQAQSNTNLPESQAQKSNTGLTDAPQTHPTDKGREEQAANVRPEGQSNSQLTSDAKVNAEAAGNGEHSPRPCGDGRR